MRALLIWTENFVPEVCSGAPSCRYAPFAGSEEFFALDRVFPPRSPEWLVCSRARLGILVPECSAESSFGVPLWASLAKSERVVGFADFLFCLGLSLCMGFCARNLASDPTVRLFERAPSVAARGVQADFGELRVVLVGSV